MGGIIEHATLPADTVACRTAEDHRGWAIGSALRGGCLRFWRRLRGLGLRHLGLDWGGWGRPASRAGACAGRQGAEGVHAAEGLERAVRVDAAGHGHRLGRRAVTLQRRHRRHQAFVGAVAGLRALLRLGGCPCRLLAGRLICSAWGGRRLCGRARRLTVRGRVSCRRGFRCGGRLRGWGGHGDRRGDGLVVGLTGQDEPAADQGDHAEHHQHQLDFAREIEVERRLLLRDVGDLGHGLGLGLVFSGKTAHGCVPPAAGAAGAAGAGVPAAGAAAASGVLVAPDASKV